MLGSHAAVTEPFTDFSVDRLSKLSLSRTYNSADWDLKNGSRPGGPFGNGWHHDWEANIICDATSCTLLRGALRGFKFQPAGAYPSPDGTENWAVYLPGLPPYLPDHHNVLVQRATGEWIAFMSDSTELHFQQVCTGCDSASSVDCKPLSNGGRARLTKVVDGSGNAVSVSYDPVNRVLLRLTEGFGHVLELRSGASCSVSASAAELRYDGQTVASYGITSSRLGTVRDALGSPLRSYTYQAITGLARQRLQSIGNEAGAPIVEFSYNSKGEAVGVVDARSSVGVSYSEDGSSLVAEYFRGPQGDTVSTTSRQLDFFGHVTNLQGSCSCGPTRTTQWTRDGHPWCSIDEVGHVQLKEYDGLGRVTHSVEYAGEDCTVPSPLPADAREEYREYGVTRTITPGVLLSLDVVTKVRRHSTLVPGAFAEDISDYDQAGSPIDPQGYTCVPSPLPSGSVKCREIRTGYVSGANGPFIERHATFYSYDAKGRLVRTYGPVAVDNPGTNDIPPIEERTYWADGETSARQGRLHEVKRYPSPTAQPLVTSYDYDTFGVSRIVAPDGSQTLIAHDARGRPTVVSQADAAGTVRATSETRYYDGLNPRLRLLATGSAERYSYDLRGRLVTLERLSADPEAAGSTAVTVWVERYAYDQAGNQIHIERSDGAGTITWSKDRAYDVQHRVVWETTSGAPAIGRRWEYDSSGFLVRSVDEEGRADIFTPDGLGRVGRVQRSGQDASGVPASIDVATYLYGASSDNLAAVQDAEGRATSYTYDDFGRVLAVTAATLGLPGRWFRYDARGNIVERGDGTVTVLYTYDGLDRALTLDAGNSADGSSVFYQYVYDEGPYRGRLTSVMEPDRTVQYAYDWAGRLATEFVTQAGVSTPLVTQYTYDAAGEVAQLTYPSGLAVTFNRAPATGRVTSIQGSTGIQFATNITYLPDGTLSSLTFGNGRTLAESFDLRGLPLAVSSGPVVLRYASTPAGDIAAISDQSEDLTGCVHAMTRTFGYDLLDRLAWWSDSVSAGGNNCPAETIGALAAGFRYVEGTGRLASHWVPDTSGTIAYAFGYDLQANVSAIGQYDSAGAALASGVCLRHDPLGRLVQVGYTNSTFTPGGLACLTDSEVGGSLARFSYDVQSRRVARQLSTGWTYFLFDAGGNLLSEFGSSGDAESPWVRLRDYVWLDGRLIAQVEYGSAGAHSYFVHTNHLGTPRAMTNIEGELVWSTFERPYGEVGEKTKADPLTGAEVVTNGRLPGQYDERLLGGLGLQGPYYNWSRWYLPGAGRYLEPDPIALEGGFNAEYGVDWYGYANQNPLRFVDVDGQTPVYRFWCGPDWTGGRPEQYDPSHDSTYTKPFDDLDQKCKDHDICYYQCRQAFPCNPNGRGECFLRCDNTLRDAAWKVKGFWGKRIGDFMNRKPQPSPKPPRDPGPNDPKCCKEK